MGHRAQEIPLRRLIWRSDKVRKTQKDRQEEMRQQKSSSSNSITSKFKINSFLDHLSRCITKGAGIKTCSRWELRTLICSLCWTKLSIKLEACLRAHPIYSNTQWILHQYIAQTKSLLIWAQMLEAPLLALESLQVEPLKCQRTRLWKWYNDKACKEELLLRLVEEDWLKDSHRFKGWTIHNL